VSSLVAENNSTSLFIIICHCFKVRVSNQLAIRARRAATFPSSRSFSSETLGSVSFDDGHGSEYVTLKTCIRIFFTHCHVYPNSLKMLNVGEFPLSWFLEGNPLNFRKRKKKSSSLVYIAQLYKAWNSAFSRRSRAMTAKKRTEKCDARAKLLFCEEWKLVSTNFDQIQVKQFNLKDSGG